MRRSLPFHSLVAGGLALAAAACADQISAPRSLSTSGGPSQTVVVDPNPFPTPATGSTSITISSDPALNVTGAFNFVGFSSTFDPVGGGSFSSVNVPASDLQSNLATRNPGWSLLPGAHWNGGQSDANEYVMNMGTYRFTTTFSIPAGATNLLINLSTLVDNVLVVSLNGVEIGRNSPTADCTPGSSTCNWAVPLRMTDDSHLVTGTNTLTVDVANTRIGYPGNTCSLGVPTSPIDFRTYALAHGWTVDLCQSPAGFALAGTAYYVPAAENHGCTLGFWKTHTPWTGTGFTTSQTIGSVFNPANSGSAAGASLVDALSFGGGSSVQDAKNLLFKQAVAALLNSATTGMNYPLTTAQVISEVNAAIATGNRAAILAEASRLEGFNSLEGPLC